ncbi:MAG: glutathione S-transferase [Acidimicrobiia bacterium]
MADATLTINSRNYGAWSLRGWLLCKLADLDVDVVSVPSDDVDSRAELMMMSPSYRVPFLTHGDVMVWDTLAIAEYVHELAPDAGILPDDPAARAHCRSICGEMHSGFANLRSALPMNIKAHHPGFPMWAGAQADVDRILAIWRGCFEESDGPYLFGARPTAADAMFAPVCTRFRTYDVALDDTAAKYRDAILSLPAVVEWTELAAVEPDEIEELDVEF